MLLLGKVRNLFIKYIRHCDSKINWKGNKRKHVENQRVACTPAIEGYCPDDLGKESVTEALAKAKYLCRKYSLPIAIPSDGSIYRNIHCAKCNGKLLVNETSYKCHADHTFFIPIPEIPMFSVLLDMPSTLLAEQTYFSGTGVRLFSCSPLHTPQYLFL